MASLTINLNLVAALRAAGRLSEPDPVQAAVLSEISGADGIAVQLRRDKKYIRERDLYLLKGVVKTKLIIEIPPIDEFINLTAEIKPWMVILADDHTNSDSPMSTISLNDENIDFEPIVDRLNAAGVNVGFYMDPDPSQMKAAAKMSAAAVMINCGGYTEAKTIDEAREQIDKIDNTAEAALKAGLAVNVSRGINYKNMRPLAELDSIDEFNIGQAVCAKAMLIGFERAVHEMQDLIRHVKAG